jgi:hypothetical protein
MGLFEFFFPEQAQAEYLKEIAHRGSMQPLPASSPRMEDLGTLALVLLALIESLIAKGVISREELLSHLKRLDGYDGREDCKVNMQVLRSVLGLPAAKPKPIPPAKPLKRRS